MTLRHLDFPSGQVGLYGTNKALLTSGIYAQIGDFSSFSLTEDPDPNITGNVVSLVPGAGWTPILRYVLPANATKCGIGRRVWLPQLPASDTYSPILMDWRNGTNTVLGQISANTTGRLVCTVGASVTTTTNPVLVANAWQHVEAVMDTAAGSVVVRVEGVEVLNVPGLTIAGPIAQVAACRSAGAGSNNPVNQYLKDLVIWDGAGAYNNDFMGSIQVRELIPDGDVAMNWATSSGSTGWDLLDEAPPNDDTDYVYAIASPIPAASKFSMSNLPVDVTTVRGVIAVVRSRKTDGGDGNLQVGLVSGASTGLGANRPITTAFTYWTDVFETDPATTAQWLPSAVNAVNLQLNRTV